MSGWWKASLPALADGSTWPASVTGLDSTIDIRNESLGGAAWGVVPSASTPLWWNGLRWTLPADGNYRLLLCALVEANNFLGSAGIRVVHNGKVLWSFERVQGQSLNPFLVMTIAGKAGDDVHLESFLTQGAQTWGVIYSAYFDGDYGTGPWDAYNGADSQATLSWVG